VGLDLQLRVAHKLTPQLRREVVVGSTNIGDPHQFIRVLVASVMPRRVYALNFPTCTRGTSILSAGWRLTVFNHVVCMKLADVLRWGLILVVLTAENQKLEQIRHR